MIRELLRVTWKQYRRSFTQLSAGKILPLAVIGFLLVVFLFIFLSFIPRVAGGLPIDILTGLSTFKVMHQRLV